MDARRLHAYRAQQALEREFDDLLGLANDVGPALGLKEHIERAQPRSGPAHMVGRKIQVSHQAASVQYG
jgi:hypothetical protein